MAATFMALAISLSAVAEGAAATQDMASPPSWRPTRHWLPPDLPRPFGYPSFPLVSIPGEPPAPNVIHVSFSLGQPDGWPPFGLDMQPKDRPLRTVQLDLWGPQWTLGLLQLRTGSARPWNPNLTYRLVPGGLRGDGQEILIFLDKALRRLTISRDAAGEPIITPVAPADTTLHRSGQALVVKHDNRLELWFESADLGATWRLARLGTVQQPGRQVTCEYEENRLVAVVYPDGRTRTRIAYEGDWATRITLPDGRYLRLPRDANGFVAAVELYLPGTKPQAEPSPAAAVSPGEARYLELFPSRRPTASTGKLLPARQLRFEHDATGRLVSLTDWDGAPARVEYATTGLVDGRQRHLTLITDLRDESYWFQRVTERIDGSLRYDQGRGQRGQPVDTAPVLGGRTIRTIASHNSIVDTGATEPPAVHPSSPAVSSSAPATPAAPAAPASPTAAPYLPPPEYAAMAASIRYLTPEIIEGLDAHHRIAFTGGRRNCYNAFRYNDLGDLEWASYMGGFHFKYDDLGRMREMTDWTLSRTVWHYDARNRLERIEEWPPANPKPRAARGLPPTGDGPFNTICRYDDDDRPIRFDYPDGTFQRFAWAGERLAARLDRQGIVHRYRYHPSGRIAIVTDSTGKRTTFADEPPP